MGREGLRVGGSLQAPDPAEVVALSFELGHAEKLAAGGRRRSPSIDAGRALAKSPPQNASDGLTAP